MSGCYYQAIVNLLLDHCYMDAIRAPSTLWYTPSKSQQHIIIQTLQLFSYCPKLYLRTCVGFHFLLRLIKPLGALCHCNQKNNLPIEIGHIVYVPLEKKSNDVITLPLTCGMSAGTALSARQGVCLGVYRQLSVLRVQKIAFILKQSEMFGIWPRLPVACVQLQG